MKNKSKITNMDKMSQLPDDLLYKILSLIPIRDAMSTCVLSKRWKLVWKMDASLDFEEDSCPNIGSLGFEEFVRRSLQSHGAQVLTSLNLKLTKYCSDVNELFPPLNFCKTLVVMKLQGNLLVQVNSSVCFQSLKSLHLSRLYFLGKECITALISSCPVLEDLFIKFRFYGIYFLNISVPSLRRLSILGSHHVSRRFEINTPSLKYLKLKDQLGRFNFVVDMPNLVEAHVKADHYETEKLLRLFTSVKRLSIHVFSPKLLHFADITLNRLLHLELHMHNNRLHRTKILSFLKRSPNLQALILNGKLLGSINNQLRHVRKPSSVPECLTFHLETLEWRGYVGRPDNKEIAVYILRNARCLKTAKIYRKKNDLRTVKDLKSISKVLTSCQLVIQPTCHKYDP